MMMKVTESEIDQFILAKVDKSNIRELFNHRKAIESSMENLP